MFTILSNGSIQTDSIDDALALAARLPLVAAVADEALANQQLAWVAEANRKHAEKHVTPAVRPVAKKAAAGTPTGMRKHGTGSAYFNGTAWTWSIGKKPKRVQKTGYASKEEAIAALDAHLAGTFVPGTDPHAVRVEPPVEVGVSPAPSAAEWSEPEDGIEKHMVCSGTGKVSDPKKLRGKTRCRPCDGEGYRRITT